MTEVVLLSVLVPAAIGLACMWLRRDLVALRLDTRGIALQTVIIMVVLLAVAGGVAAVLLSRGGEAVTDIERQEISRQASDFSAQHCARQPASSGPDPPHPATRARPSSSRLSSRMLKGQSRMIAIR